MESGAPQIGNPLWWGRPPVHIISRMVTPPMKWEIIWTGGLPHYIELVIVNPLLSHNHLFFLQDWSQKFFSTLKKIQDLPTRGVHAVEHLTINANRFPAFAPAQTTKVISKAILHTLIYKQNDSTGNVSLYWAIGWDFNHLTSPVQSSGKYHNKSKWFQ